MSALSLFDVFKYAHCTPDTRNFVEDEQVLLPNMLFCVEKLKR